MTDDEIKREMQVLPPPPETPREPSPLAIYAQAIDKGLSVEQLAGLLDLHERIEAKKAEAAYAAAMAAAQAEMPTIVCDAYNQQTKSKYAKLELIVKRIKPVYTKHGFSLEFGEGKADREGHCRTTCIVGHAAGHSKPFYLDLPLDGVGIKGNSNMTAIHGRLSSDTYAQSRLLKKIFNLTIQDDPTDDDGNAGGGACSDEQIGMIRDLIASVEKSGQPFEMARWLKWLKVAKLEEIRMADFDKAVLDLNQRRKGKQ